MIPPKVETYDKKQTFASSVLPAILLFLLAIISWIVFALAVGFTIGIGREIGEWIVWVYLVN